MVDLKVLCYVFDDGVDEVDVVDLFFYCLCIVVVVVLVMEQWFDVDVVWVGDEEVFGVGQW